MFLAVLGYRENESVQEGYLGDEKDAMQGQIGAENFFANDLYRVLAASIAFQDTGETNALVDSELQADRLAQYAAGGLDIAEREFGQTAGDPTDAIVNYIRDSQTESESYQGTLGEIVKDFDDEMMGLE